MDTQENLAEIEVVSRGMLQVLSVGKGDMRITFNPGDPKDVEKARQVVGEMLRKGYVLFVETPQGLTRVKRFSAKLVAYVIAEMPEPTPEEPKPKVKDSEVPLEGSKVKAIGRTAGG